MSAETRKAHVTADEIPGRKHMPYKQYRLEWPDNLLDSIFGDGFHKTNTVTDDQLAAIDYVIATGLNDMQQNIIHYRYQKQMTLVQIAAIYNVSRERIRQIEAKVLHMLRKPVCTRIIQMGLKAFYEQDIKNLYYTRQNMLATKLSDIRVYSAHDLTHKTVKLLGENGFTTVGDLVAFTLNDKRRLGLGKTAYNSIVSHYQAVIKKQNAVISALETHMGKSATPTVPYPTNLFDAIYGKTDPVHTGALPTRGQIDGLNYIMEKNLSSVQQTIIYYIYEKGLSVSACSLKMHFGENTIRDCLRDILRILRQQPDCYAYIDGVDIEKTYTQDKPNRANPTVTSLADIGMHENIRNILGAHHIETVQELIAQTDEELRTLPYVGEHVLREVKIRFPKRNAYASTCAYLAGLHMSITEQKTYLKSIQIDRLDIPCKSELKSANLATAEDVFLSNNPVVTDEIRDKLRIIVCLRATNIQNMPLSVRATNALRAANIYAFDELNSMTDEELLSIRNIGVTTVQNIRTNLDKVMKTINRPTCLN